MRDLISPGSLIELLPEATVLDVRWQMGRTDRSSTSPATSRYPLESTSTSWRTPGAAPGPGGRQGVTLGFAALCWCGRRATHNARTKNGETVTEGDVVVVGDVSDLDDADPPEVGYEVLRRQHHRCRMTAARARAVSMIGDPLPFG